MKPTPLPPGDKTTLFVWATVILAGLGSGAVLLSTVIPMDMELRLLTVTTLLGIIAPIVSAFIAAAIQQVHLAINGRLGQLLKVTSEKATAEEKVRQNEASKTGQDQ